MKSIHKMLCKVSRKGAPNSPKPAGRKRRRGPRKSKDPERSREVTGQTVTGQTVFGDLPLRFRSLTITGPDLSLLENPSEIAGAFKIRVAERGGARRDAGSLVQQRYAGRGYAIPLARPQPRVSTFIAYDEGSVVGTVGLGADSEHGLSADDLYRDEINKRRAVGYNVCEFTRLAVDRTAASKAVLAGLFHTAYLYASRICGYNYAVIEVNPRHVVFYRKALKFEPIGPERLNTRVNAPAVLLGVSFDTISSELKKYAGKSLAPGAKRTLFHYGFPLEQEAGVFNRLLALSASLPGFQEATTAGRRKAAA